jgi:hypothetical protein
MYHGIKNYAQKSKQNYDVNFEINYSDDCQWDLRGKNLNWIEAAEGDRSKNTNCNCVKN